MDTYEHIMAATQPEASFEELLAQCDASQQALLSSPDFRTQLERQFENVRTVSRVLNMDVSSATGTPTIPGYQVQ